MRFFPALLCFVFLGCGQKSPTGKPNNQATALQDTSLFYPLEPFLDQEISYVELRDLPLEAHWERGKTTLETSLSKSQWLDSVRYIKAFIDQYWRSHKDQFQENSFEDLGTEKTVFDYAAKDSSYALKQVTLQTDTRTQQIQNLYLVVVEKNAFVGNTVHRITWKAQNSLQWVRWLKDQPDSLSERLTLHWKKPNSP